MRESENPSSSTIQKREGMVMVTFNAHHLVIQNHSSIVKHSFNKGGGVGIVKVYSILVFINRKTYQLL